MGRCITEQIDDICSNEYGHTHWAFADTCSKEELKEIKEKDLGDIMPGIVFYHEDVREEDY